MRRRGEQPNWVIWRGCDNGGSRERWCVRRCHGWEGAMSRRPRQPDAVPAETARVARAAFPKGNAYVRLRDELGVVYTDEQFAGLFPRRGQPALAPWRLALVSVLQFAEDLSDRQAADAVRGRIDWKY